MKKAWLAAMVLCVLGISANSASAQKNGYLGFRVTPVRGGGLKINSFLKNTPALEMSRQNPPQLVTGDIMLRLNGRRLFSVRDVFKVTDNMRAGDPPAKLELEMPDGREYYVYINPAYLGEAPCKVMVKTSTDKRNAGRPSGPPRNSGRPSNPGRPSGPGRPR